MMQTLTRKQTKLWSAYREGTSLDVLATRCGYKTKDEMLKDLRDMRWNHWKATGEKV